MTRPVMQSVALLVAAGTFAWVRSAVESPPGIANSAAIRAAFMAGIGTFSLLYLIAWAVRAANESAVQARVETRTQALDEAVARSELLTAVRAGDADRVRDLVGSGADVAETGPGGTTAMMLAAAGGNVGVLAALAGAGRPVDDKDGAGKTALAYAAIHCRLEAARWLIDRGADVNSATPEGRTPLVFALCQQEPLEIVKELLARGARVNFAYLESDDLMVTPLALACMERNAAAARLLLAAGADVGGVSDQTESPTLCAVACGSLDCVKALVEQGASPNMKIKGVSLIALAKERGHTAIVSYLRERSRG